MQENYAKASNDSTESGAHFPRRSVFLGSVQAAAALTGGAVLGGAVVGNPAMAKEEEKPHPKEKPTADHLAITEAGLTEAEAECWAKVAEAAGAFFQLPELHSLDKAEVATAVHVIQNKLLGRPTYRKYLAAHKANEKK